MPFQIIRNDITKMQLDAIVNPAKTLFVITTDDLENSSRKYSFSGLKKLIQNQQEKYHWEYFSVDG